MSNSSLPERPELPFAWAHEPDPMSHPELFDGIIFRRVVAYMIDIVILTGIAVFLWVLVVLTLGLLGPIAAIVTAVLPIGYHTLLIGGPNSATIGMRMMGVEVRRLDGGRPDLVQALVQTVLFYGTLALTGLLLVVAFFNDRRRCLHDWLSGTLVVNAYGLYRPTD
jgi:uncharacterized RDD family membrane protein YckC